MAFLTPNSIRTVYVGSETLTIKSKIIPDNYLAFKYVASYVKQGDPLKPCKPLNNGTGVPKGITIHNTEDITVPTGTTPAEQYCRATYNCNMGGGVVHFYVYKNDIWQLLSENEQGWHAADGVSRRKDHRGTLTGGNVDTIAIECIGNISESKRATAMLTAHLCHKYNLDPKYDVYTHNWWMYGTDSLVRGARKNCPIYILDQWSIFVQSIKNYYDAINEDLSGDDEDMVKIYQTINDVPAGEFRDVITTLMNTPVKHGTGNVINGYEDGTIRLSDDMVRMLVINYRAGLYDM